MPISFLDDPAPTVGNRSRILVGKVDGGQSLKYHTVWRGVASRVIEGRSKGLNFRLHDPPVLMQFCYN